MDQRPAEQVHHDASRRAVLLTSYQSGATEGRNLATSGYSYDFVASAFEPLLGEWGKVQASSGSKELEAQVADIKRQGADPIHVVFRALQHVDLCASAPNVVVPAWEFPDVPNHAFDGNARNNWVRMANACDVVIVGGPYTVRALRRGGVHSPIHVVPVPIPKEYFTLARWDSRSRVRLDCPAYVFPQTASPHVPSMADLHEAPQSQPAPRQRWHRSMSRKAYQRYLRRFIPLRVHRSLGAAYRAWQEPIVDYRETTGVELSGVVYTSIFAPIDGRKNWEDLLSGFLVALRDAEDTTLVLKLITKDPAVTRMVLSHYMRLDLPHRCKVVVIDSFLSHADMLKLAEATTYYLTTTRAEGNCLPLMNYLAAARPAVSPDHTAISDYFDRDIGLVVESHREPTAWPQDSRLRSRTYWQRLVWPSLVEQLSASYRVVRSAPAEYQAMAERAQQRMLGWAGTQAVRPRLMAALDAAVGGKKGARLESAAGRHAA